MKYILLFDVTPSIGMPLCDGKPHLNSLRMEMSTAGQGMTDMHGVRLCKPWRIAILAMVIPPFFCRIPLPRHVLGKVQAVTYVKNLKRRLPM